MNDLQLAPLLQSYADAPSPGVMEQLVEGYLPLSRAIARKFGGRGVDLEDLEQVAAMALMKAIERFEPERGLKFITYAIPTIAGEVRNYLRDRGSVLRISRDVRTRLFHMQKHRDQLIQELQREPSIKELAARMEMEPAELLSLLDQRDASEVLSLSSPINSEDDAQALGDMLGTLEQGYEQVEQKEWMTWVMRQVTPTEQKLLEYRFVHRLGQRETARYLGVSQMQVSRLERRLLSRLRELTERWQEQM